MTRRLRGDDRGTSLLIVLLIITAVSLVMGVVLSQEGTSVKATETLQDQSATNYGADAAAQAVVTQLKNGRFDCSQAATSTLTLGNGPSTPFYQPVGTAGGSQNAVATCTPDTTTGVTTTVTGTETMVGPANTPAATVTTVGSNVLDGIDAGGNFLCVQGSVVSYTSIAGPLKAGQSSTGSPTACPDTANPATKVQAYGNPLPIIPGCLGVLGAFWVTNCTSLGASTPPIPTVPDPGLPITKDNTNQSAVCQTYAGNKIYAAFLPGLYTQASALSTPCTNSSGKPVAAAVDWFTPGVYYFNFTSGSITWSLPAALVGGTPATAAGTPIAGLNPASRATLQASTLSNLSQMPTGEGKCIPPTAQTRAGEGGVEFVFGGPSTMTMTTPNILGFPTGPTTDLDICATYSASSPPVAIYGVYQKPLIEGTDSTAQIPPQAGCVIALVGSLGCLINYSLINSSSPIGNQTFHIDGYVWAPSASIVMSYLSPTGQAFNWGVLVRTFQLTDLNLVSAPLTMAAVPPPNPGQTTTYTYSIRYLNVWTCPASSTPCPQTGAPAVQVKVQQSGSTWKVLSWSEAR